MVWLRGFQEKMRVDIEQMEEDSYLEGRLVIPACRCQLEVRDEAQPTLKKGGRPPLSTTPN